MPKARRPSGSAYSKSTRTCHPGLLLYLPFHRTSFGDFDILRHYRNHISTYRQSHDHRFHPRHRSTQGCELFLQLPHHPSPWFQWQPPLSVPPHSLHHSHLALVHPDSPRGGMVTNDDTASDVRSYIAHT